MDPVIKLADGTQIAYLETGNLSTARSVSGVIAQAVTQYMNPMTGSELIDVKVLSVDFAQGQCVLEIRTRRKPEGGITTL